MLRSVHKVIPDPATATNRIAEPSKTRLSEDLLRMYKERKFCDVTLHVQQKTFPAHKNILCARSPVFQVMFETDAIEKRTGTVEITDLEPDTVGKMLTFMYSDVLDLKTSDAIKLYSAADKYEIRLLKYECSTFLKSKFDASNILQILTLADLHHDKDLYKSSVDYIANYATNIFKSGEWKNFASRNGPLAADVMHTLFAEKGVTCSSVQNQRYQDPFAARRPKPRPSQFSTHTNKEYAQSLHDSIFYPRNIPAATPSNPRSWQEVMNPTRWSAD